MAVLVPHLPMNPTPRRNNASVGPLKPRTDEHVFLDKFLGSFTCSCAVAYLGGGGGCHGMSENVFDETLLKMRFQTYIFCRFRDPNFKKFPGVMSQDPPTIVSSLWLPGYATARVCTMNKFPPATYHLINIYTELAPTRSLV